MIFYFYCDHRDLHVEANVNRVMLTDKQVVGAVLLNVKLVCKACSSPFWFPGLPTGTAYTQPTTTTDGFQLTAPAVQANRRCQPDPSLPSVIVRNNDSAKGYRR